MDCLYKRNGFILSLLLVGCATVGGIPGDLYSYSWSNTGCYRSMKEDIQHLAAGPIVDCGFIGPHTDAGFDKKVRDCARQVIDGDQGYAFGYAGMGDDSWFCDVSVRSADGELWSLYYDSDVTGQMGLHGDHSRVWISHCDSIKPMPGTISANSFFMMEGCKEAPDALRRITTQRKRS
jgi:hypothetical protein